MKLRTGYLISGIVTGIIILFGFILTLPDGKLHVVFCNVGQGDAAYIRFPDGKDMLIDGGPNNSVLDCLGRHMPFWDRRIDLVALTHPQKDHMQGLISVVDRYSIGYMIRSDVSNSSDGFELLQQSLKKQNIPVRFMVQGNKIQVGTTMLSYIWPSSDQIAKGKRAEQQFADSQKNVSDERVLGAQTGDLNDYSLVQLLQYGSLDVLFTGDADDHVEHYYTGLHIGSRPIEILKVPHHGSKTGMTDAFISWIHPAVAIISVGKNTYGHPSKISLDLLANEHATVYRTDEFGDIEIISDGTTFSISTQNKK